MSDGLSVSLFNRDGREVGFGLDVTCIRVNVPRTGQTIEGPVVFEVVGGRLAVTDPKGEARPWELDLPAMDGRAAVDWTAERGATMTRGKPEVKPSDPDPRHPNVSGIKAAEL